jgi:hypothetical protein
MANSLTPLSPTYWSKIMGVKLYKKNVFRSICSFREEAVLKDGQIVDRPYRADVYVQPYTKGTALTAQDITATSDQLTVNKIFAALIYVDDVDKIQNKWDAASAWTEEIITRLANQMDADALFQGVYEANDTIDYNDLDTAQTAGAGIILTTSNVLNLFTVMARKLDVNNVSSENRFSVISPQVKQILLTYLAGRESILGDKTGEAGMIGSYMGLKLYVSNNLTSMVRITPTDNPSNSETLIINGITITFETTPATVTSGFAVDIGGDTATTIDNLVTMINTPTTDSASVGKPATGSNLAAIQRGWFAVDGTTYVDIYIKGASVIATPTGTAQYTTTYNKQLNLCGEKGAIDFVAQKEPSAKMASTVSAGKDGMNVLCKDLYAVGVFYDMQARLFRVEIDSTNSFS